MNEKELEREICILKVKVNVIVETLDSLFYKMGSLRGDEYDDDHHVEYKIMNRLRELGLEEKEETIEFISKRKCPVCGGKLLVKSDDSPYHGIPALEIECEHGCNLDLVTMTKLVDFVDKEVMERY